MVVEVKDLEPGDEIIFPSNSYLVYAKVLSYPKVRAKQRTWFINKGKTDYKNLKCSCNIIENVYTYSWGGNTRQLIKREYACTPEEHNTTKYFDLNDKTVWLINKKSI